jgi:hypothetical protein
MMNRRAFLYGSIAATLATPPAADGQQAGKVWCVGYLGGSTRVPPVDGSWGSSG